MTEMIYSSLSPQEAERLDRAARGWFVALLFTPAGDGNPAGIPNCGWLERLDLVERFASDLEDFDRRPAGMAAGVYLVECLAVSRHGVRVVMPDKWIVEAGHSARRKGA